MMKRPAKIALGIGIIGVLVMLYLGMAAITATAEGRTGTNLLIGGFRTPGSIMELINMVFVANLVIWGSWLYFFLEEN
ncbi:hypothetical protein [Isachenkonia alkalipeptolytica]|uniref:Uncharacterized protein n=1 Tax=Isachenkonia alkalipeptolytica TaxID=2565777 RepID=A0AA44BCW2_9CLOT|nr:hypothetical protein [Isachenkonia alkalipeptolytica]NBG87749.1 hypothetical protein [Isachenkonia alkalipeptolytica]